MRALFILAERPRFAGTTVYAEELMKELGAFLSSYELFVISEVKDCKRALLRTIKATQPDVVHVLFANPGDTLRIGYLLRGLRIPKVLTVHQIPPKESRIGWLYHWPRAYFLARGLRFFYSRLVLLWALRYYSALLAPNQTTKASLEKLSKGSVYTVPLGISLGNGPDGGSGDSGPPGEKRKPRIVTVAAFMFHKGIHQMLEVLPKIIGEYPGLQYVVAGTKRDPSYFRHLEGKVLANGLKEHVQFLPDAEAETVAALYRECDVYIQPSYEEGFCLTFLQALYKEQGRSKPFVLAGGTTGEIPTLLELAGMKDFLFDAKSASSLEKKLRLALQAAGNGFSPKIEWQRIRETYSWERAATETYKVYEEARAGQAERNLADCRNHAFGSDL